jgi:hypothetical protein
MSSTYRVPADYAAYPQQPAPAVEEADEKARKKDKKGKKDDERKFERAVDTMFRTAYQTHVNMTSLADGKANIMLTVNTLMISILVASLSSKVDTNKWLMLPTSLVLLGCLVSIAFAVLAVRPRINPTLLTLDAVRRENGNILFFGNYVHLSETEFRQGLAELSRDPERLYDTMGRDLYGMGSVLQRKFRFLRGSYDSFLGALVVGVIAFIISYVLV